jgi:hypothetical protein
MKKLKGLLLAATVMLTANSLMAQTYSETALMFSRIKPAGSARILGMGGAQISLGGDYSSAFSNPAGLGMYNKSEFTISPGYLSVTNNGTYSAGSNFISGSNTETRTALNIPGLSLVFSQPQEGDGGFIHGSFGISMTRINDFNSNIHYRGTNTNSSLIDYFIDQANGATPDQFGSNGSMYNTVTELAYDNYIIGEASILDPSFPNDQYFTDFDRAINPAVIQDETIQTKGAQNQWNLSYGANFNDKFFFGAGLGIVSLNFQSHKVFSEQFTDQPISRYTLTEDLSIKGTGVNFTVGGIFRPVEGFQVGASIATPTRYNLNDNYSATLNSMWNNWDYYGDGTTMLNSESASTDVVSSGYNLTTPWKFSAGASYIFGKRGLVSVDVERLNYGGARYNSQTSGVSYNTDNDDIKATYTSVTNIRAGGELRAKAFRFRAGFNYMPDPYKQQQNGTSITRMAASAGVGYKGSKYFVDLAYINSWGSNTYRPYTVNSDSSPLLKYDQTVSNVVVTVGFNF